MTPEEIAALINKTVQSQMAEGLKAGFGEFRNFFTEQLTPINGQLKEFKEALTAPEETITESDAHTLDQSTPTDSEAVDTEPDMSDPGTKALIARLAVLEAQAEDAKKQAAKERFDKSLRSAIAPETPLHGQMVEELLSNRYRGLVEKEGQYYTEKGETLNELVQTFFSSPEGQHFKPAKSRQGSGETPTASKPPASVKGEVSLDEMLLEMNV